MFHHILLATDLLDVSERALAVATALARGAAARLTILYVYEVSAQTLAGTSPAVAERTWPGPMRLRKELDRLATGLRATGVRADAVIEFGEPALRIAEVARLQDVDLVVTGTHGRRGLARIWHGSVAERVLRRCSSAPFLAVPMGTHRCDRDPLPHASRRRSYRPVAARRQDVARAVDGVIFPVREAGRVVLELIAKRPGGLSLREAGRE